MGGIDLPYIRNHGMQTKDLCDNAVVPPAPVLDSNRSFASRVSQSSMSDDKGNDDVQPDCAQIS